jgi:hypothetical protein
VFKPQDTFYNGEQHCNAYPSIGLQWLSVHGFELYSGTRLPVTFF